MTPERWAQIEELFHHACECDSNDRDALLDETCRTDPELRREVQALLASEENARDHLHAAVREQLATVGFPLTGETISHYRIIDGLSGGGMGLVYRAEDIKLGRRVALKFLPEDSVKDSAALGRFEREARAASALEHPNICPIYEFGEHQGQPFLVMQLLEGQTLRELISSGDPGNPPLTLAKLLDLAIQVTAGLEAAHSQSIIHRDIKPANLFVTSQGQVKILDFGLAKLASLARARDLRVPYDGDDGEDVQRPTEKIVPMATPDAFLSLTGVAMGTAGYMSPEQVRGEKLDARTDLFSFGLVLYEMTTGQRAFKGDTGPVLQKAILNETPFPVRELNPEVPAKLEQIVMKALEKDREARYQSASDLHADLETLKRRMERKLPVGWQMIAAGVAALLLIASSVFWFTRRQSSSYQTLLNLKLQQLTINSSESPVTGGAISPDGKYVAYTDAKGMHIKSLGSDKTLLVPQLEALNNEIVWEIVPTAWFPDSKRFLVNAHPANESSTAWSSQTSSIWMVSVLGGAPRKLRDNAVAWSVSPDGSSISFGASKGTLGDRELWLMGPNGEQARTLYQVDDRNAICCLNFFPNGQRVSYILTHASGDTLVARDLRGGPIATLLPPSEIKKMGDFSWLPDGRFIYSDACNGLIMRFDTPCNYWIERLDTRTGELLEKPRRLTNWVGFWMNTPSVTADSKRVAFLESSAYGASYLADLESGGTRLINSRRVTSEEGGEDAISDWTADNKTVILVLNRGDHYSLYRQSLNADAQEPIVTSTTGGLLEQAFVSPDGNWVIIEVWPTTGDETVQLMRVPITGGTPELIFRVREGTLSFCARPPSNLCAVAEQSDDHKQMIITAFDPVKGRGPELARFDLSPEYETGLSTVIWNISPDGTRLAAARGPAGPIQIRSLQGQQTQVIQPKGLNHIRQLQWAADGKALFVSNVTNGGSEIVHVDLDGNTKLLWKCGSDVCFGQSSPDGRHLAIYEKKLNANMWMLENF